MTPPIGFRTDSTKRADGTLMEIRPPQAVASSGAEAVKVSSGADRAYRIAALTAGLALIATFL